MKALPEIKPCKCGVPDKVYLRSFNGWHWWVNCTACDKSSRAVDSKVSAVETWNGEG